MESQHMTQQTFAQLLGISSASLSSIFNDRTKPTLNHVDAIKKKFPSINLDWLLYGNGSMFLDENLGGDSEKSSQELTDNSTLDFGSGSNSSSPLLFDTRKEDGVNYTPKNKSLNGLKYNDIKLRKVSQIQVIYDDDTIEIFVPKK